MNEKIHMQNFILDWQHFWGAFPEIFNIGAMKIANKGKVNIIIELVCPKSPFK